MGFHFSIFSYDVTIQVYSISIKNDNFFEDISAIFVTIALL